MSGRVFLLGDNIDTDQLAPGQFMKGGIDELAAHCLESVYPNFAQKVKPNDIIVAGKNFGMGSSREQAAEALKHLGLSAVVAESFGGIYYRNSINLGLPALIVKNATALRDGDLIELSIEQSHLSILSDNAEPVKISLEPVPENIQRLLNDGGLVAHLKKRFARERFLENNS